MMQRSLRNAYGIQSDTADNVFLMPDFTSTVLVN